MKPEVWPVIWLTMMAVVSLPARGEGVRSVYVDSQPEIRKIWRGSTKVGNGRSEMQCLKGRIGVLP